MTTWLPGIIVSIALIAVMWRLFSGKKSTAEEPADISNVKYRYRQRNALFNPNEIILLNEIEKAAGHSFKVFSKVHVSHILIPKSNLSIDSWNLSYEKVVSKHFDFVLCSAEEFKVQCVIMLVTDKSIKNPNHRFLMKACRSVGLEVINLSTQKEYTASQIRYILKKHIPECLPTKQALEVPSVIKERRKKVQETKKSVSSDNLQKMLLTEGRRRAQKIKKMSKVN
ncbi:MAG: DUF2726 domain-containing protein [Gammaproteobacteria bacterium]|nr:DUF2726 domain-containing protein [Gammaproteobacteria bacterium]